MLDSPNHEDVREARGYEQIRCIASLAIVSAVFEDDPTSEINTTPIALTIANNFASGTLPEFDRYNMPNIGKLAIKLL